jgi:hypothetical protein
VYQWYEFRDHVLFTCRDGPVHGYFFLPKYLCPSILFSKKSLCHALVCLKKSCDPANKSDCLMSSALYIFNLLLYGCEIWGFDDNVMLVKVPLKFRKMILNIKVFIPNNMIYTVG